MCCTPALRLHTGVSHDSACLVHQVELAVNLRRTSEASVRRLVVVGTVLLALFIAQAVLSLRQKSVTTDEIMYITAGYYHLRTGDFGFNATNPPLMKLFTALPLLGLELELPKMDSDPSSWSLIKQWQYSRSFLYGNRIDADTILFYARLPIVALGAMLGVYVLLWSRQLYGDRAGLLALFLYVFSPNILAHTRLATHDLGVTAFMFIAAYYFWQHVKRPNILNLFACGTAWSAAVLTKTTALFMIPVVLLFSATLLVCKKELAIWPRLPFVKSIDRKRVRARQLVSLGITFLVIGCIAFVALHLTYALEGSFQPLADYISTEQQEKVYERLVKQHGLSREIIDTLLDVPSPVPAPFAQLVFFQNTLVSVGHPVYFAGEVSHSGWWYLMSIALLIKTPIALLVLLLAALYQILRIRQISPSEWLILLVIGVVLTLFTFLKSVGVGIRYVLPIFPFLHVLVSRVVRDELKLQKWGGIALVGLVVWYAAETLHIYPHYLAYFNEFIGGPRNGYRYLADSHLDWGQDLKGLKKYLDDHDIERIKLAYFGSADAQYYGIDYDYLPSVGLAPQNPGERWWFETDAISLPPFEPSEGPIAVSATLLAGIFFPGYYSKLRELEPVDQIGYSILIYDPE